MSDRNMLIGAALVSGYGTQQGAWRMPGVDPAGWADVDNLVRFAQAAERGLLQFLFLPDFPALREDIERESPMMTMDPLLTLTAIARETQRIGLVATGATTFAEPFTIARQFKALDVISHGRAGWNAVPMSDPMVAANFSQPLPSRQERYERLHETVQVVQALWGSWGRDAWIHDQASGRFADASKIQPVGLRGKHVASRGPLAIPPSEQGQPVIFQAGGGGPGAEVAGRYASGVIGAVWTIDDARAQRAALREAAARNGRNPDEVKFFAGVMPTIKPTRRAALDRRIALTEGRFEERAAYLQQMLGVRLDASRLDEPLSPQQLANARPSPQDPRSAHALRIAREGWNLRDIIAHGVIDYHPVIVGPAVEVADHMQEWFEAGAVDGFWVSIDVYRDGMDTFVDEVVPILQQRGLFHTEYDGPTLRDNLGVPAQYGLDPRVAG